MTTTGPATPQHATRFCSRRSQPVEPGSERRSILRVSRTIQSASRGRPSVSFAKEKEVVTFHADDDRTDSGEDSSHRPIGQAAEIRHVLLSPVSERNAESSRGSQASGLSPVTTGAVTPPRPSVHDSDTSAMMQEGGAAARHRDHDGRYLDTDLASYGGGLVSPTGSEASSTWAFPTIEDIARSTALTPSKPNVRSSLLSVVNSPAPVYRFGRVSWNSEGSAPRTGPRGADRTPPPSSLRQDALREKAGGDVRSRTPTRNTASLSAADITTATTTQPSGNGAGLTPVLRGSGGDDDPPIRMSQSDTTTGDTTTGGDTTPPQSQHRRSSFVPAAAVQSTPVTCSSYGGTTASRRSLFPPLSGDDSQSEDQNRNTSIIEGKRDPSSEANTEEQARPTVVPPGFSLYGTDSSQTVDTDSASATRRPRRSPIRGPTSSVSPSAAARRGSERPRRNTTSHRRSVSAPTSQSGTEETSRTRKTLPPSASGIDSPNEGSNQSSPSEIGGSAAGGTTTSPDNEEEDAPMTFAVSPGETLTRSGVRLPKIALAGVTNPDLSSAERLAPPPRVSSYSDTPTTPSSTAPSEFDDDDVRVVVDQQRPASVPTHDRKSPGFSEAAPNSDDQDDRRKEIGWSPKQRRASTRRTEEPSQANAAHLRLHENGQRISEHAGSLPPPAATVNGIKLYTPRTAATLFTPRSAVRRTIGPIKVSRNGIWERLDNGTGRVTPRPKQFDATEVRLTTPSPKTPASLSSAPNDDDDRGATFGLQSRDNDKEDKDMSRRLTGVADQFGGKERRMSTVHEVEDEDYSHGGTSRRDSCASAQGGDTVSNGWSPSIAGRPTVEDDTVWGGNDSTSRGSEAPPSQRHYFTRSSLRRSQQCGLSSERRQIQPRRSTSTRIVSRRVLSPKTGDDDDDLEDVRLIARDSAAQSLASEMLPPISLSTPVRGTRPARPRSSRMTLTESPLSSYMMADGPPSSAAARGYSELQIHSPLSTANEGEMTVSPPARRPEQRDLGDSSDHHMPTSPSRDPVVRPSTGSAARRLTAASRLLKRCSPKRRQRTSAERVHLPPDARRTMGPSLSSARPDHDTIHEDSRRRRQSAIGTSVAEGPETRATKSGSPAEEDRGSTSSRDAMVAGQQRRSLARVVERSMCTDGKLRLDATGFPSLDPQRTTESAVSSAGPGRRSTAHPIGEDHTLYSFESPQFGRSALDEEEEDDSVSVVLDPPDEKDPISKPMIPESSIDQRRPSSALAIVQEGRKTIKEDNTGSRRSIRKKRPSEDHVTMEGLRSPSKRVSSVTARSAKRLRGETPVSTSGRDNALRRLCEEVLGESLPDNMESDNDGTAMDAFVRRISTRMSTEDRPRQQLVALLVSALRTRGRLSRAKSEEEQADDGIGLHRRRSTMQQDQRSGLTAKQQMSRVSAGASSMVRGYPEYPHTTVRDGTSVPPATAEEDDDDKEEHTQIPISPDTRGEGMAPARSNEKTPARDPGKEHDEKDDEDRFELSTQSDNIPVPSEPPRLPDLGIVWNEYQAGSSPYLDEENFVEPYPSLEELAAQAATILQEEEEANQTAEVDVSPTARRLVSAQTVLELLTWIETSDQEPPLPSCACPTAAEVKRQPDSESCDVQAPFSPHGQRGDEPRRMEPNRSSTSSGDATTARQTTSSSPSLPVLIVEAEALEGTFLSRQSAAMTDDDVMPTTDGATGLQRSVASTGRSFGVVTADPGLAQPQRFMPCSELDACITEFSADARMGSWAEALATVDAMWPDRYLDVERRIRRFPASMAARRQLQWTIGARAGHHADAKKLGLWLRHMAERNELVCFQAQGQWKLEVSLVVKAQTITRLRSLASRFQEATTRLQHTMEARRREKDELTQQRKETARRSELWVARHNVAAQLTESVEFEREQKARAAQRLEDRQKQCAELEEAIRTATQHIAALQQQIAVSEALLRKKQAVVRLVTLQKDVIDAEQDCLGYRLEKMDLDVMELQLLSPAQCRRRRRTHATAKPERPLQPVRCSVPATTTTTTGVSQQQPKTQEVLSYDDVLWSRYLLLVAKTIQKTGATNSLEASSAAYARWDQHRAALMAALFDRDIQRDVAWAKLSRNVTFLGLATVPPPRLCIWWRYDAMISAGSSDAQDAGVHLVEGLKLQLKSRVSSNFQTYIPVELQPVYERCMALHFEAGETICDDASHEHCGRGSGLPAPAGSCDCTLLYKPPCLTTVGEQEKDQSTILMGLAGLYFDWKLRHILYRFVEDQLNAFLTQHVLQELGLPSISPIETYLQRQSSSPSEDNNEIPLHLFAPVVGPDRLVDALAQSVACCRRVEYLVDELRSLLTRYYPTGRGMYGTEVTYVPAGTPLVYPRVTTQSSSFNHKNHEESSETMADGDAVPRPTKSSKIEASVKSAGGSRQRGGTAEGADGHDGAAPKCESDRGPPPRFDDDVILIRVTLLNPNAGGPNNTTKEDRSWIWVPSDVSVTLVCHLAMSILYGSFIHGIYGSLSGMFNDEPTWYLSKHEAKERRRALRHLNQTLHEHIAQQCRMVAIEDEGPSSCTAEDRLVHLVQAVEQQLLTLGSPPLS